MKKIATVIFVCLFVTGAFSLTSAQAPVGDNKSESTPSAAEPKKDAAAPANETKTEEVAALTPGLYHYEAADIEFTEEEDGFNGTGILKFQLDLKADGTFTTEAYLTSADLGVTEQLFYKNRGKWKQDGDKVVQSELLEQYYNVDSKSMSPWAPPEEGKTTTTSKIRNVTKDTFQEYDEDSKTWYTWTKL